MTDWSDGGPAFPREDYQADNAPGQRGMSLRDYFAAQAINACIFKGGDGDGGWDPVTVAVAAYAVADAMLAERAQRTSCP